MTKQTIILQYALTPNEGQLEALSSHSGAARFTYNWALRKIYDNWEQVKNDNTGTVEYLKINLPTLRKMFNQEKDIIAPWWKEKQQKRLLYRFNQRCTCFRTLFQKTW